MNTKETGTEKEGREGGWEEGRRYQNGDGGGRK